MTNIDLSTKYIGLQLSNPLVPSASPLTRSLDSARLLEDAGAAAIVMHSLFEEDLKQEEETMERFVIHQGIGHGEADSFLPVFDQYQHGLDRYLEQIVALKQALKIPVIASLNGISLDGWVTHGEMLEQAGADALELNVYYIATDLNESSNGVESRYLELLRKLRGNVSIPIAMKLSPYFSSLPAFIRLLEREGVDGISLFNRFYQPDIDPDNLLVIPKLQLSSSADALLAMRWIALLYRRVGISLAATGGVHTSEDVVKMLLAGADVTHLCSALLIHGPEYLKTIKDGLVDWIEQSEYTSIEEFKGRLSEQFCESPDLYERANYIAVLNSYSSSIKESE